MGRYAHKGQILPLENQMIPIDKETTFHASYDYGLDGMNQNIVVAPNSEKSVLDFDGTGYIDMGNVNNIGTRDFSLSVWFKTLATGDWIVSKSLAAGQFYRYALDVYTGGVIRFIAAWNSTGHVDYPGAIVVNDNKWHNATVTIDRDGLLSIYIDGVLDKSFDVSAYNGLDFVSNNPFRIGAYTGSNNVDPYAPFDGSISDVRLWSKALSVSEVKTNMYEKLSGNEYNLIGHYRLNEKEGPISFDHSPNQNDGVWNGGIVPTYGPTVASKAEGKFRDGVLIEPDTTNLLTGHIKAKEVIMDGYHGWKGVGVSNDNPRITLTKDGGAATISVKASTQYTFSAIYWSSDNILDDVYLRFNDTGWPESGSYIQPFTTQSTSRVIKDLGNGWKYCQGTFTTLSTTTTINWIFFDVDTAGVEVFIANLQLEERNGATSYVDGSRPLGQLWYPKELVSPSAFTISCWFNIPYMHRTVTSNAGINGNWFHPIIEIATPTNSSQSFGIVAGPEPSSWNRRIQLQVPGAVYGTLAVQDDTWYHLTCTYDGATYRVYIDGTEYISYVGGLIAPVDGQVLMVGGGYRGKSFIKIDEVRIESRAISVDEVSAWAASGLHYNYLDYSMIVD